MSDRIRFRRLATNEDACPFDIDESVTQRGDHGWVFERLAP